jgi:membrane-bound lytic murein transglycosylase D
MNPELLRLVTPPDPEFVLRLPEGTAERFFAEIAAIPPEKWVSWRRHKVERGETLSSIAKQYRVSPAEVADANELATGASLEEGQKLIIPAASRSDASTGKLIRYRVRRTDTISTIADEFDVTTAELRKWNHLRANRVVRGTSLRIYPGGMTPAPERQARAKDNLSSTLIAERSGPAKQKLPVMEARSPSAVVHRVKPGETLWSIARAYQTTVEAIQAGNRYLFSRPLQVGDTLTILPTR